MKNVFRRFLIVCYMLGALSASIGVRGLIVSIEHQSSLIDIEPLELRIVLKAKYDEFASVSEILLFSGPGIWILCFLAHFVFLGILNPLRLFKPMAQ